jgi:hemolysin activation/secretion protein
MLAFTPPPQIPPVITFSQPKYGAEPTVVESHGFKYVVTGNTLISPEQIQMVLRFASDPEAGLSALLRIYYSLGYRLVAITGQISGQTVQVSVFQGILTELQVPDSLTDYFGSLEGRDDVRTPEIIRDQILAQSYADRSGKQLHVNLVPASNPGGSVLTIKEADQPGYFPVDADLNFGNYGSRYSSAYVAGGSVSANLTHGLQISANLTQGLPGLRAESFGSNFYQNGISGSAVTPYGTYGVSANWTHYRLGQTTYPLYPDGNVFDYQITGTQLFYADESTRLALNEAFNRVKYREKAFNGFYTLVDQQYNYLSFGPNVNKSFSVIGLPGSVNAGVTFNIGISSAAGGLVDNMPGAPTSHFKYTNLAISENQALPGGLQTVFTGQAQISTSTLPSQQQWVLGGFGNLTAWEPGAATGDSGYAARLELDAPTLAYAKSALAFGAFGEVGGATFRTPSPGTFPSQTLADIGLSLKIQLPEKFSATAMTALPIKSAGFDKVARNSLKQDRLDAFFVVQKGF